MNENELPPASRAIQEAIFQKAQKLNQRLLERFTETADYMSSGSHLAVLGALEGAEEKIASIRSLMLLLRDFFAPLPPKGGAH
jgi:hypothetical protein